MQKLKFILYKLFVFGEVNHGYGRIEKEVIAFSKTIGIDKIGFASPDPFTELKQRLIRQQELGYQSGFEEKDIEKG